MPARLHIVPPPAFIATQTDLTPRQDEVVRFLARAFLPRRCPDRAMAGALETSVYTAHRLATVVLKGLDVDSRAGVAVSVLRARQI